MSDTFTLKGRVKNALAIKYAERVRKGGPGSGFFYHAGRSATHQRGGSIRGPRRFDMPLPDEASQIIRALHAAGGHAVVVGGAVRDFVSGKTPHDFDLASSFSIDEARTVLNAAGHKTFDSGAAHGTLTVFGHQGGQYELTMFRRDVNADGRHAEVEHTTDLLEDLQRRDFTCNALAYSPEDNGGPRLWGPGENGSPDEALKDIRHGVVRFVGNGYDRLVEDRLRALRGVRIANKNGWRLDPTAVAAIGQARDAGLFPGPLSQERVRDETIKMLALPNGVACIEEMRELGLLAIFHPEIQKMVGVEQNAYHYPYTVYEHTLRAADGHMEVYHPAFAELLAHPFSLSETEAARAGMRLTMLCHDMGKAADRPDENGQMVPVAQLSDRPGYGYTFYGHEEAGVPVAAAMLDRLHFSAALKAQVLLGVREHMAVPDANSSPQAIRRWARKLGTSVDWMLAVAHNDRACIPGIGREAADAGLSHVQAVLAAAPPVTAKFPVTGADVLTALGYTTPPKTGDPRVGKIMAQLKDWVDADPARNDREQLLAHLPSLL